MSLQAASDHALKRNSVFGLSDICTFRIDPVPVNEIGTSAGDGDRFNSNDNRLKDDDWLNIAVFPGIDNIGTGKMLRGPDGKTRTIDSLNAFRSSGQWKFTSTALGGHFSCNPRPQFTRYADIRAANRANDEYSLTDITIHNTDTSIGAMGRYYSEAIDDNAELIYMQFGVPEFNNIISFFTRAISYEDAFVANTGRLPVGYTIGKVFGGFVMFAAFPLVSAIVFAAKIAYAYMAPETAFDYYYMKPSMITYWGAVNNIVNQMATELGLVSTPITDAKDKNEEKGKRMGLPVGFRKEDLENLDKIYPGMINTEKGYIDMYVISAMPQVRAQRVRQKERAMMELGQIPESQLLGWAQEPRSFVQESFMDFMDEHLSFDTFVRKVRETFSWATEARTDEEEAAYHQDEVASEMTIAKVQNNTGRTNEQGQQIVTESATQAAGKYNGKSFYGSELVEEEIKDSNGNYKGKYGFYPTETDPNSLVGQRQAGFAELLDAQVRQGAAYAVFTVDYTGSQSDSFNNSIGSIQTSDTIKSVAQGARNMKFSFSGGNILGNAVNEVIGGLKGVVAGALDSVTMGLSNVITTLTGGAFIDIPKKWDDSDAQISTISYNIDLVSPYGNTLSQLQNIYIPLAMLMAGSLPQKAGEASYASPFLCSIYNKGKQNIRLGMISSLTIERGTGNLAFDRKGKPLQFKVSFTVTDFSNIMTAPISASLFAGILSGPGSDTGLFGRYMGVICARGLYSDKYLVPRALRRIGNTIKKWNTMTSPGFVASVAAADRWYNPISWMNMGTYENVAALSTESFGRNF